MLIKENTLLSPSPLVPIVALSPFCNGTKPELAQEPITVQECQSAALSWFPSEYTLKNSLFRRNILKILVNFTEFTTELSVPLER